MGIFSSFILISCYFLFYIAFFSFFEKLVLHSMDVKFALTFFSNSEMY